MPREEKMVRPGQQPPYPRAGCTDLCPRYLIGHEVYPHRTMRNLWRQSAITDEKNLNSALEALLTAVTAGMRDVCLLRWDFHRER